MLAIGCRSLDFYGVNEFYLILIVIRPMSKEVGCQLLRCLAAPYYEYSRCQSLRFAADDPQPFLAVWPSAHTKRNNGSAVGGWYIVCLSRAPTIYSTILSLSCIIILWNFIGIRNFSTSRALVASYSSSYTTISRLDY